jgi:hypothetical protein
MNGAENQRPQAVEKVADLSVLRQIADNIERLFDNASKVAHTAFGETTAAQCAEQADAVRTAIVELEHYRSLLAPSPPAEGVGVDLAAAILRVNIGKPGPWAFDELGAATVRGALDVVLAALLSPSPASAEVEGVVGRLEEIDRTLPAGPWEVWTSCSFRRITGPDGKDGHVLSAYNQRGDGHPDLSMPETQLQALVALRNEAPALATLLRSQSGRIVELEGRGDLGRLGPEGKRDD